jgi:hypothetical protein
VVVLSVACCTQCDKVRFRIAAAMTTKLLMVNFQVRHLAAPLTSPTVATEHLLSQIFIGNRIEPKERALWANPVDHDAFALKGFKKSLLLVF